MKKYLLIFILFICIPLFAQKTNEDCFPFMQKEDNSFFKDTTHFSNGGKLYYLWNCDSTWLTFQGKEKVILKSCSKVDPILCSRLGLQFLKEYNKYLLFLYNWSSGCCTTPDLVFIDKKNGQEIKRITNDQFVCGDNDQDYSMFFTDTTYMELVYLNHQTNREIKFQFKDNRILKLMGEKEVLHPSKLIKQFRRKDDQMILEFVENNKDINEIRIEIKK